MRRTVGRVPVRIDLAGGTLDIWPVHLTLSQPGVTVNAALDLPAEVTVEGLPSGAVEIRSLDRGESVRYASIGELRTHLATGGGATKLLARAIDAVVPEGGVRLTASATSPAGAGLGGSSALLACVVGTLAHAAGRPLEPEAVRRLSQDLETWVIHGPTGYQDYYPPLLGGCLALEGAFGGVRVERLPVDLAALSRRLRLVYTGAPHHSGITNWGAMRAWFDREPTTVAALEEIAGLSREVRGALRRGDLDRACESVVAEGRVRLRMAPGISTPAIEHLDAAVRQAGALGTKVMGAGGGGCVLVVLRDGRDPAEDSAALLDALATAGGRALPCRLADAGLALREGTPT